MEADTAVYLALLDRPEIAHDMEGGNLQVLFACESGSRAWEFQSSDSDYDIRFVYSRPNLWYLALEARPDNIQVKQFDHKGTPVDAVGWDIQKFLKLARKSNASAYEWVFGCPAYYKVPWWDQIIKSLLADNVDYYRIAAHHRGLAHEHDRKYLERREVVSIKKYLYTIRSLLNFFWYYRVARTRIFSGFAPITLSQLVNDNKELSYDMRRRINDLIIMKIGGTEDINIQKHYKLEGDLDTLLNRADSLVMQTSELPSWNMYNAAFRAVQALTFMQNWRELNE